MTSSTHSELDEALRCARLWVERPLTDEEWTQASRTQALPAIRPDVELLARNLISLYEQLEALRREKHELVGVAGGVLWIDNNMHLYGTKEWREYFKAVVRDARHAYELRDVPSPAKRPT